MSIDFEAGIKNFFERRETFFRNDILDCSFQQRMKVLRDKVSPRSINKPQVVILGAGPAGLLRAIQSISNGNPTTVIERRGEDASRRINTVALTTTTITILRYCGIYQYLIENSLIFPEDGSGFTTVRLADLEIAMHVVLKEICPTFAVQYNSKVIDVVSQSDKITLIVEKTTRNTASVVRNVDVIVNAEGKNSTTNDLLGIKRSKVLPSIPVIAAVYKDKRPKIQGLGSFFRYVGRSIQYLAQTIYYHTKFLFKFVFSKNFRAQITGSLILKTPGQNYVGCGFSDGINSRLETFKQSIGDIKKQVREAENLQRKSVLEKQLKQVEKEYREYARSWIHDSLCYANLGAVMARFSTGIKFHSGKHLSLSKFEMIYIGADVASEYCRKINQGYFLLAGDASATVDPTTGLGCNTAIQSSVDFLDFIWDYDEGHCKTGKLQKDYEERMAARIKVIHEQSKFVRSLYRPDALMVQTGMAAMMRSRV